jgi:acyl carrier protein
MDRAQLTQILGQILEQASATPLAEVTEATRLQDGLGLDSLAIVHIVLEVQDRLDLVIRVEDFDQVATVGDLLTLLQAKLAENAAQKAA